MADNDENEELDSFPWWKISLIFLVVLAVGILLGVIPWVTFYFRPDWASKFPEKAGLWGDSFGFVKCAAVGICVRRSLSLSGLNDENYSFNEKR